MKCSRCHEETTLREVSTGRGKSEDWCDLCVEQSATKCVLCQKLTRTDYGYKMEHEGREAFVCPENLLDWTMGERTQGVLARLDSFLSSVVR